MSQLAIYLSTILASIIPSMSEARRSSIASDVADVVLTEDRIYADDETGQRTALLMLSIAHYESGRSWAKWIDSGECNDPTWRERHATWLKGGDCESTRVLRKSMVELGFSGQPPKLTTFHDE